MPASTFLFGYILLTGRNRFYGRLLNIYYRDDHRMLVCVTSEVWEEPKPPAIAKINYYDNYKLIAFIHDHYIKVVSCTATTINVESQFCKDGTAYTEEETIRATMQDVRDYLGY